MGWDSATTWQFVVAALATAATIVIALVTACYSRRQKREAKRAQLRAMTSDSSAFVEVLTYSFGRFCLDTEAYRGEEKKNVPSAAALRAWACNWAMNRYADGEDRATFLEIESARSKMKQLYLDMADSLFRNRNPFPGDFRVAKFLLFIMPLERANAELVLCKPWGPWMIQSTLKRMLNKDDKASLFAAAKRQEEEQSHKFLMACWDAVRDIVDEKEAWADATLTTSSSQSRSSSLTSSSESSS